MKFLKLFFILILIFSQSSFAKKSKELKKIQIKPIAEIAPVEIPNYLQGIEIYKPSQSNNIVKLPKFEINKLLKNISTKTSYKETVKVNPQFQLPLLEQFKEMQDPKMSEYRDSLKENKPLSLSEEKYLQARIFLEVKKNYKIALGLLSEVLQESKELKTEATYFYGETALQLGLHYEHRDRLLKIVKESTSEDWIKNSILSLTKNAIPGDTELVQIIDSKIEKLNIDIKNSDQYQLNRAQYYSEKNDLTHAFDAIDEISIDSKLKSDALMTKGILQYRAGQVAQAENTLKDALKLMIDSKSETKSIIAITLARIQFQKAKYKEAFQTYLAVNKGNPLWMQAMVEQAWTQILMQDYEGAAGNMFTLHTDFFKNSFSPDSYIARSIGYLNLCQYGDGSRVVYSLNQKYQPLKSKLDDYINKNKSANNYYDTVRKFFKNPNEGSIDGLQRNFIYELARHPQFVKYQKRVNSIEDQINNYNNVSLEILGLERKLIKEISDLNTQITKSKKEQKAKMLNELVSLKLQYEIAKRARNSIKLERENGIKRLELVKSENKTKAALALQSHFKEMRSTLDKSLDQSELIYYELYSGAGENLRFQLAGGEITDKERAALKVKDHKALKWEFSGEVWEDELGHFRSGLKSVCPKEGQISQN